MDDLRIFTFIGAVLLIVVFVFFFVLLWAEYPKSKDKDPHDP